MGQELSAGKHVTCQTCRSQERLRQSEVAREEEEQKCKAQVGSGALGEGSLGGRMFGDGALLVDPAV